MQVTYGGNYEQIVVGEKANIYFLVAAKRSSILPPFENSVLYMKMS